jgi:hypothetical protein
MIDSDSIHRLPRWNITSNTFLFNFIVSCTVLHRCRNIFQGIYLVAIGWNEGAVGIALSMMGFTALIVQTFAGDWVRTSSSFLLFLRWESSWVFVAKTEIEYLYIVHCIYYSRTIELRVIQSILSLFALLSSYDYYWLLFCRLTRRMLIDGNFYRLQVLSQHFQPAWFSLSKEILSITWSI